jgi:uncharacterized protein YidB (DUF937 family)
MGLFDQLLPNIPGLGGQQSQILSAAASLLSQKEGSVGGTGGLSSLVAAFQQKGLGNVVSSWISTGSNLPVSAAQLEQVLGTKTMTEFADRAGVAPGQASSSLAAVLPNLVDHLTPDGQLPQGGAIDGLLTSVLAKLGQKA